MSLENEVCSFDLAVQLEKDFVPQDSIFKWVEVKHKIGLDEFKNPKVLETRQKVIYGDVEIIENVIKTVAAYTSHELLEMIPSRIELKSGEPYNNYRIAIRQAHLFIDNTLERHFLINYECDSTAATGQDAWLLRQLFPHNIHDKSLANTLAMTLLYLIHNSLLEAIK